MQACGHGNSFGGRDHHKAITFIMYTLERDVVILTPINAALVTELMKFQSLHVSFPSLDSLFYVGVCVSWHCLCNLFSCDNSLVVIKH